MSKVFNIQITIYDLFNFKKVQLINHCSEQTLLISLNKEQTLHFKMIISFTVLFYQHNTAQHRQQK